jgi:hypothetical protein
MVPKEIKARAGVLSLRLFWGSEGIPTPANVNSPSRSGAASPSKVTVTLYWEGHFEQANKGLYFTVRLNI